MGPYEVSKMLETELAIWQRGNTGRVGTWGSNLYKKLPVFRIHFSGRHGALSRICDSCAQIRQRLGEAEYGNYFFFFSTGGVVCSFCVCEIGSDQIWSIQRDLQCNVRIKGDWTIGRLDGRILDEMGRFSRCCAFRFRLDKVREFWMNGNVFWKLSRIGLFRKCGKVAKSGGMGEKRLCYKNADGRSLNVSVGTFKVDNKII